MDFKEKQAEPVLMIIKHKNINEIDLIYDMIYSQFKHYEPIIDEEKLELARKKLKE